MSEQAAAAADRYVSFEGIDCWHNACAVVARVLHHYEGPERTNKYWEYFVAKIPPGYYSGEPTEDLLYLVCSNTYYIEELFEKFGDAEGLQLLQRAELECC
ncbi:N(2)-fixation sustaining protein CowN [Azospira oryzae]|jgi:hypothetical protein|uniref:N(2)-fixation sustaining protein CowN n=1 Tax=Azospira oryzae TaxID=146939 RepID=UPI001209A498|nr:N(2)-fixation sustaining protein CowN [Azospira oryzae]TLS17554.1 MAG: N(2)-fixation sustaining protein CowN [Betaproteobacteria bacterium]